MLQERTWNKNKRSSVKIAAASSLTAESHRLPRNRIAPSWILSGVIAGILAISASTGQATDVPVQTQPQRQYDIPAGALDRALKTFASQAGVMLSVDAALTAGKASPGLKGSYTIAQGFEALLTGSGLQATEGRTRDYSLSEAAANNSAPTASDQSANVRTLGKIKVQSDLAADGSAEQGYRSDTVSAVGPWQGRTLQDTPYSITVISEDLIKNLQATSPDQIVRVVPTVQLIRPQYDNDQTIVSMRGFDVFAPYRDGIQAFQFGVGTAIEDVERVEVFTGLSGFLYGPGNVGGMINYVSKRPTAERLNSITLGNNGGSNWYVHGDLGGPIDSAGRFGYRINGDWQGGETAIENMHIDKRFISGAFDWHVTDELLWTFDASYRDYEVDGGQGIWFLAAGVVRPAAEEIDASVSWGQPWTHQQTKDQRYGTQLRWNANDTFTMRAAWQYSYAQRNFFRSRNTIQSDGTYTQRVQWVYAPGEDILDSEYFGHSGNAFADTQFKTGAIVHTLTTGVQYQRYWSEEFQNRAPNITYSGLTLDRPTYFDRPIPAHVDRGSRNKIGDISNTTLLLGDDITFDSQWSLLAGAAYSTIDIKSDVSSPVGYKKSAVTPNVSLIYKPVEAITTYGTYIESLEQGGVAGANFNGLPVVNAGDVFEPLISKQVEVGAKWPIGGMLLTTAVFQIDKALQYFDVTDPDAVRFVQDGRQVHRGIEFTVFGKLTHGLTLTGGFTVLDAKVKEQKENPALEGKRPQSVAETFAKLRAEYRLPFLPALSIIGSVNYTGHSYGNAMNTDRVPGYTLFDVGARYEIEVAQHPLTLRLDVNNLADKAYWIPGAFGSLGTPRTVLFSVNTQF